MNREATAQLERRGLDLYAGDSLELRIERSAGQPARLVGYAARFNSLSKDLGGIRERILPGAFRSSLAAGKDIRALVNHNPAMILGRTSAGTLRLSEDATGLRYEIDLPDTTYARDLAESVRRGDVNGASFGFIMPKGGARFTRADGGASIRELSNIDLREITVTSVPAYEATSAQLRADASATPAALNHAIRRLKIQRLSN